MKKRLKQVANFIAFNLLFFALYLNFIHKDSNPPSVSPSQATAAITQTVLVENPEPYLKKEQPANSNHKITKAVN